MKKLLFSMMFLLSFSAWSYSFFPLNPSISVFPGQISAQVFNPYYEPILCSGYTFGMTMNGRVYQASFQDILPAGQFRYAMVYTNPFNPFVRGWADIRCRFLRY